MWGALAPDAQLQGEIAQAVQAWIRSPEWQRESGRFIPKPSNWLRGKRWRDVVGMAAPSPQPAGPPPSLAPAMTPAQLEANRIKAREVVQRAKAALFGTTEVVE